METINLKPPTDEGYANIARMFVDSILSDVTERRRDDARAIMDSLIECVAYLAVTEPSLVAAIRKDIVR